MTDRTGKPRALDLFCGAGGVLAVVKRVGVIALPVAEAVKAAGENAEYVLRAANTDGDGYGYGYGGEE